MFRKLKTLARQIQNELRFLRCLLRHPRTPLASKILLWLALAYLVLPFDLIPDWIPVLGQLDDLIIVPALVLLALKMVPTDVKDDCRRLAETQ